MELFNTSANDQEDGQEINTVKPHSELIINQIPTLPLHFKLVLYAYFSLLGQNKTNMKAALTDVFIECELRNPKGLARPAAAIIQYQTYSCVLGLAVFKKPMINTIKTYQVGEQFVAKLTAKQVMYSIDQSGHIRLALLQLLSAGYYKNV